jgi:hypothetical protein
MTDADCNSAVEAARERYPHIRWNAKLFKDGAQMGILGSSPESFSHAVRIQDASLAESAIDGIAEQLAKWA